MKQKLTAEFLGTFILVFAGTGAIIVHTLTGALGHSGIALTFGLVLVALIYSFGHISGAHFNPAVTIAFSVVGEFKPREAFSYILAQISGAVLASGVLIYLFLEDFTFIQEVAYLGVTLPRGSEVQSFAFEFILTFILMLIICASSVSGKAIKSFAGVAFGFIVGIEVMFGGPISGASMNPARSIAPAIVSGHLDHLWLYVVATIVGAIFGALVFKYLLKSNNK
jgi:aquaporin Z